MGARNSIVSMLITAVIMAIVLEINVSAEMPFTTRIVMCLVILVIGTILTKILVK